MQSNFVVVLLCVTVLCDALALVLIWRLSRTIRNVVTRMRSAPPVVDSPVENDVDRTSLKLLSDAFNKFESMSRRGYGPRGQLLSTSSNRILTRNRGGKK